MVRVRFAPSPTGLFHIGSARTALFNWLYARHTGGVFILRIEDTDKERNTPEALRGLYHGMRWLGLNWDEGPEAGGDSGPYFQSERTHIYREYLVRLRESGRAYDRDGAVYFRVSNEPQTIKDAIRGDVVRKEEKDFVIFRSDGTPVFHFAVVVDDITMKVTHVIRGEDHLSNSSKHTELFSALGATMPVFAHIPLILKAHGKGKMSKRNEGFLLEDYEKRNFLAEAVRNYLCLLGWSPKDDREIIPIDEIISLFDFSGVNRDGARFDERKLAHINTTYLRKLPVETFAWMARPLLESSGVLGEGISEDYFQSVLGLCQEKVRSLDELPAYVEYFFRENFSIDEKARKRLFRKGEPLERLGELLRELETVCDFGEGEIEAVVKRLSEQKGIYTGEYIHPVRLAVSGTGAGPGLYSLLRVLGKERTLNRIREFLRNHGEIR